tara:strand:+ start:24 stop:320 length:297 start_codon:yes stop_codon:yes gene_type:complete
MIVIQLQNFWANEPNEIDITDMGAVMIKDGKLYFNDSGVAWGGYEEITQDDLNAMTIATYNKMIEDLKELDKNLDLETINMSSINHGEYLKTRDNNKK